MKVLFSMVKKSLVKLLILITISIFSPVYSVKLDPEECAILDSFMRALTINSEVGYVLHGKKPVCVEGYHIDTPYIFQSAHKKDVILKVGAALWKEKYASFESPYIFHLYDKCDQMFGQHKHLIIIKKDLLVKTIQENLPLFQYALGPSMTPESLLKELTKNEGGFNDILKNNKVLIGILLGFGTQNSLFGSRLENIQEELMTYENPPFKPTMDALKQLGEAGYQSQQTLLLRTIKPSKKLPEASFPYSTLRDEVAFLRNNLETSSHKLYTENPSFVFGLVKNEASNVELIKQLELTQEKIRKLNQSEHYLEQVFKFIFPKDSFSIQQPASLLTTIFSEEQKQNVIARVLWKEIRELNTTEALEGMNDADCEKNHKHPHFNDLFLSFLIQLKKGFQNIAHADLLFQQLENEASFQAIVPKKIIFRTIEEGSHDSLKYNDLAELAIKVESPDGSVLTDTWDASETVDTGNLLPAFAKAIRGMKINEVREIYIHPLFAYGLYTPLEKGIHLKCTVKLLEIKQQAQSTIEPELQELDYSRERNFAETNDKLHTQDMYDYDVGYKLWSHFKKMDVAWGKVHRDISAYQQDPSIYQQLSEDELNQLDRLHWNVYHRK